MTPPHTRPQNVLTPALFTCTIFLSAALLFFVQPLFAKIVLPHVGGAPAVWTTAMLFFQSTLIAGYLYAHLSARYLPVRAQVVLHLLLWAGALAFLPLAIRDGWQLSPDSPIALQTLALFAAGVGMPFAVLSANAPLIQSWYARSGGPSADDPYFLYSASNLGSFIALLAFPLVAEPLFGATQISWGWAVGFVVLGLFLGLSGQAARFKAPQAPTLKDKGQRTKASTIATWLVLAFVPTSLMLAVTTQISTDLGSFPLIWVLPLALYLLTFVISFNNRPWLQGRGLQTAFVVSLGVLAVLLTGVKLPGQTLLVVGALLVVFFIIALKSHQMLYAARPDKGDLTFFYVIISVGGALGGLFNAILAPVLFVELHEMRVTTLVAACMLLAGQSLPKTKDLTRILLTALVIVLPITLQGLIPEWLPFNTALLITGALLLGGLIGLRGRSVAQFAMITLTLAIGVMLTFSGSQFKDRSFFGTHEVKDSGPIRIYTNGTTIHGAQEVASLQNGTRPTPLYYYHPSGPMAQILAPTVTAADAHIGIIGQGVGSLACYAQPGQDWQFYEIDAMVDRVARDPALFSFMQRCAGDAPTHIGDARVVLTAQTQTRYDVLIIDAYSSDAVPVHLTTHEALRLYRDRLDAGGLFALHISNRYYDIALPLGRSAAALGLAAYIQAYPGDPDDRSNVASTVVVMARADADLAPLLSSGKWTPLVNDGKRIWTDDYANLLSILRR